MADSRDYRKLDSLADFLLKNNRTPREDAQLRERLDVLMAWIAEMRNLWRLNTMVRGGVDIHVTGRYVVNRAGNKILLFSSSGAYLQEFPADAAGLAAAFAAAGSGTVISLPACDITYSANATVSSGVVLMGMGLASVIREIDITINSGGVITDLVWTGRAGTSAAAAVIVGIVSDCSIWSSSNCDAVQMLGGHLLRSYVINTSSIYSGIAFYASQTGYIKGCTIYQYGTPVASTGVFINPSAGATIWIEDTRTYGCSQGFDIRTSAAKLKNCVLWGLNYGLSVGSGAAPNLRQCSMFAQGGGGATPYDIYIDGGHPVFYCCDWDTQTIFNGGGITYEYGDRAPANSSYLVLGADANLTSERVFAPDGSLTVTDDGAGGDYHIGVNYGYTPPALVFYEDEIISYDDEVVTWQA